MRLARVAAGALVVGAVLTGCSGKQPANDTLPSAAPTSAESSESLPPLGPPDLPMPTEAREQTPAGVQAFTEYYISLINRLENDLDGSYLRNLSRNCDTCDRIAEDAESDALKGYVYKGGSLTISSMGTATLTQAGGEIAFTVNQAPLDVVAGDGRPVEELTAPQLSELPAGLTTVWSEDHWLISSLSFG
jgi:hypothetical protein